MVKIIDSMFFLTTKKNINVNSRTKTCNFLNRNILYTTEEWIDEREEGQQKIPRLKNEEKKWKIWRGKNSVKDIWDIVKGLGNRRGKKNTEVVLKRLSKSFGHIYKGLFLSLYFLPLVYMSLCQYHTVFQTNTFM